MAKKTEFPSAQALIHQHKKRAESYALDKVKECLDNKDVRSASTWLKLSQTIYELQTMPKKEPAY